MIKDLVVRQRYVLAQKAIFALRQHTRVERQRKYMIDQGQANNNYHLVKRVFCALCTQTSRERHNRYAHEQMQDFIAANRQRTALQSLYKAVISAKILGMVYEKVNLRVNRRAAMDCLQKMR